MKSTATAAQPPILELLRDVVSLTKPRLSGLVILTTAGAAWMAGGANQPLLLLAVVAGTTLVVGAANTLNCYLERDVDALMTRTADRPLPAGRLEPEAALGFGRLLMFIGLPLLTLGTNLLTGLLGAVALVTYVFAYTPLKRRSATATLVGAVPGALPPLIGWTAVTGRLDAPGLALFSILFVWQIPHFLAIGLFRREEYQRAGFRILPLTAGEDVTRRQIFRYAATLVPVSLLPVPLGIAGAMYLGVALVSGLGLLLAALPVLQTDAPRRQARRFFFATLIYLTALVAGMVADAVVVAG